MRSIWSALEQIRGPAAVPWIWRRHLGDTFGSFAATCLQRGSRAVRFYPCPRGCGCAHEVVDIGTREVVGVCRCESWNCDDLQLKPEDVLPLELSWPRLSRALVKVLDLESKTDGLNLPNTRQIGSWSAVAVPVILTIQETAGRFRQTILELAARLHRPFILFAPTATHLDAGAQELLAQVGAGFFSLEASLAFLAGGTLRPVCAPGELFARFTPEPKPAEEDLARRAFALVQQLDSQGVVKPPNVLSVFRLYCVEGLSLGRAARKLDCSKTTILRRLRLLQQRTGVEPEAFRRFSPQLSKIEDEITDSRARHIHRRNVIAEETEEEE